MRKPGKLLKWFMQTKQGTVLYKQVLKTGLGRGVYLFTVYMYLFSLRISQQNVKCFYWSIYF